MKTVEVLFLVRVCSFQHLLLLIGFILFVCVYFRRECSCLKLMLSSTLLFAELLDLRRSLRGSSHSLSREVWTTEDASPKFAYLVLRNARRPNVTSPDYLPNLLGSLDRDGNTESNRSGGKKFLGHIVRGNFGLCFTELIVAWVA